ncbi:MAG: glycosyltransferase family 4 protein [Bacteroidota bacterium]
MKKIIILRQAFDHIGSYSGYDRLCYFLITKKGFDFYSITNPKERKFSLEALFYRFVLILLFKLKPNPFYSYIGLFSEIRAIFASKRNDIDLIHITHIEDNFGLLSLPLLPSNTRLIGTAHQPKEWYEKNYLKKNILSKLDAIIVLATNDKEYFENILPGKVHIIPHGIDTDFFTPKEIIKYPLPNQQRILYIGNWMRDKETFYLVVKELVINYPDLHFDMVVPKAYLRNKYFDELRKIENVHWYSGITDIELRELYQNATLLFLPLLDSTANNAILEAMSCGLPIISSKIGGVKEYTDDSFAELFTVGDVEGFKNCIKSLLNNPELLKRRAKRAREFAEENFSMKVIGENTLKIYEIVFNS